MTTRTRHILGILGLGFVLAALAWLFLIFPELDELPKDFHYAAEVTSYDNFYDSETEQFLGEQQSRSIFSYDVRDIEGDVMDVQNVFSVSTLTGEPIFSVERLYGINRYTREHVVGYGDRDRNGFLFGPRMKWMFAQVPDKAPFTYWHINYNAPAYMEFRGEENLFGTTVYRYEANFNADQTEELSTLPEVGTTRGVALDVRLELWIEPHTGHLVKYSDAAEAWYYSLETGERLYPWNKFRNAFSEAAVQRHAEMAVTDFYELLLLGFLLPTILITLAVIVWGVGLLHGRKFEALVPARVRRVALPLAVLVLGLVVTFFTVQLVAEDVRRQIRSEFEAETAAMVEDVEHRFAIYTNVLVSARGLLFASNSVERDEWHEYVEALSVQENYPGIQGVGYAVFLAPSELDAHVAQVRAEGFPDYTVRPAGERDLYSSIVFIEPFDKRNQQAFGFDMYQEANRRSAMDTARDSGKIAASRKVTLVQEIDSDVQAGLLIYAPYYGNGLEPLSVAERRERIEGYVYEVFRVGDFINGVFPSRNPLIAIEIFDGFGSGALSSENRVFNSRGSIEDSLYVMQDTAIVAEISVANTIWTAILTPDAQYGLNFIRTYATFFTMVVGTMLSILLAILVYFQATAQYRAVQTAERLTKDLRQSRDDLEALNKEALQRLSEVERLNKLMVGRELKMIELKEKLKEKS